LISRIQFSFSKIVAYFLLLFTFLTFSVACRAQTKRLFLWVDASANWVQLSDSLALEAMVQKTSEVGFTDLVIDVKPNFGYVLYPSKIAPRLLKWKGVQRSADYDYLAHMIQAGTRHGLKIHAALNIFSEGSRPRGLGLVYESHPEWQTILYQPDGLKPISQVDDKQSMFVNPAREDVQKYELSLIAEIVRNYPKLTGIILDRARFDGISSDFSQQSRQAFEGFLNKKAAHWPNDIFSWQKQTSEADPTPSPGPLFKKWIFWRAKLIHDFFVKARNAVKAINPQLEFGDYAGSWYPTYYEVGVNWASKNYQPPFWWADSNYYSTGYAELLDFFMSGCYYFEVTIDELKLPEVRLDLHQEAAMKKGKQFWYSVEGACDITNQVIQDATTVYGSLFVQQYKGHPLQFKRAVEMALNKTDGLMLFDLIYIAEYDWWDLLQKTFTRFN